MVGKTELEEAVGQEAKRWKDRLHAAGQESDELRKELDQTISRCPCTSTFS